MDGLGLHMEDNRCRSVHRAAAECFRGLQHLATAEHGYADIKVMEMLKVLPGLARLTQLTTGDMQPPCTDPWSSLHMRQCRTSGFCYQRVCKRHLRAGAVTCVL